MKKWSDREFNAVEWVINYISPDSVDGKYREDIRRLKDKPVVRYTNYSQGEREAIKAAISYFEDFYTYSIKGLPKGNKTVGDVLTRLMYLRGARKKLELETDCEELKE